MFLFIQGRKETFSTIADKINPADKTVWIHCASLGEFEQGRPIIENIKVQHPDYKIILSFFSPSGYEVRKNYKLADVVVYLPIDTPKKALKFIEATHPTLAIFVKYEFWPNLLKTLKNKNINTILISGIFREKQAFFKKNNTWFKNTLKAFSHFFVQDNTSVKLLSSIGIKPITLAGDTRFDRVIEIVKQHKEVPFLKEFTHKAHTLVAGSTWPKDESLLIEYINRTASNNEKFIIAPHNIKEDNISNLEKNIIYKTIRYSNINTQNIRNAKVLIIDSIGILTNVYAYADVAYVGGGFGVGIHNILEPATYGVPIIIGPNYQKFKEATDLINLGACFEITNTKELSEKLLFFTSNNDKIKKIGVINFTYIKENSGASKKIMEYVKKVL